MQFGGLCPSDQGTLRCCCSPPSYGDRYRPIRGPDVSGLGRSQRTPIRPPCPARPNGYVRVSTVAHAVDGLSLDVQQPIACSAPLATRSTSCAGSTTAASICTWSPGRRRHRQRRRQAGLQPSPRPSAISPASASPRRNATSGSARALSGRLGAIRLARRRRRLTGKGAGGAGGDPTDGALALARHVAAGDRRHWPSRGSKSAIWASKTHWLARQAMRRLTDHESRQAPSPDESLGATRWDRL